ncbi:hypothetical protein EW146_g9680 [Bondarzewia mesenterica]|uniref:Uncharacterized protein n=1 Tax=Bondarzewia mesenterica TaxID=1095465 RepID=A0A4S4L4S1_9AGAM|nr:hypothetical protein EW146_g9680 [Bondarzewia mesenterica]
MIATLVIALVAFVLSMLSSCLSSSGPVLPILIVLRVMFAALIVNASSLVLVLYRSAPLLNALYRDCFYTPCVASLTHLTLRCCFYDRPDVTCLLDFLKQNPRLEMLRIIATDDM